MVKKTRSARRSVEEEGRSGGMSSSALYTGLINGGRKQGTDNAEKGMGVAASDWHEAAAVRVTTTGADRALRVIQVCCVSRDFSLRYRC